MNGLASSGTPLLPRSRYNALRVLDNAIPQSVGRLNCIGSSKDDVEVASRYAPEESLHGGFAQAGVVAAYYG